MGMAVEQLAVFGMGLVSVVVVEKVGAVFVAVQAAGSMVEVMNEGVAWPVLVFCPCGTVVVVVT